MRDDAGPYLWFARRSPDKPIDPGFLDNLVGGGIAAGSTADATLVKEAWEEAGIPEAMARRASLVSVLHVKRAMFDGLQRETVFAHDLLLPPEFVPANQDGEAVEHRLVDLAEAARTIGHDAGLDQVTLDASLVVLDYLIRHGEIAPGQRHFPALDALLRRGAD